MIAETLSAKVFAVTGATSGVGRATVETIAELGGRVVAGGRRTERLDELEASFQDAVEGVAGDCCDPHIAHQIVEVASTHFGGLDAVVICAGVGSYGGICDLDDDAIRELVATNLLGTIWMVRAAVPALRARGGGHIVIVASVAALRGWSDEAVYASTKAAQVAMAGALDKELRPDGIRIATICPAAIATEFAIGTGRSNTDPERDLMLDAQDVADAICVVLRQPAKVRTGNWVLWGNNGHSE